MRYPQVSRYHKRRFGLFPDHRVILTSVVLAAKFFDDRYYSNKFYAAVGGVRTKELNALEAEFLRLISKPYPDVRVLVCIFITTVSDWNLHTLPEEYEAYRMSVWSSSTSVELALPPLSSSLSTPPGLMISLIKVAYSS